MSAVEPQRVRIRRADSEDARSAADILLRSGHASVPAIPPLVHTDDEVRAWFGGLAARAEVWLAESNTTPVAVMVLDNSWIDQLYVDPEWTDRAVGSALVDHAKTERPDHLQLWTFQTNLGAQRFYERHGFVEVDRTAGDNEEGAPDIRYRWAAVRMSDTPSGPGWWQATDGKWYPPQPSPDLGGRFGEQPPQEQDDGLQTWTLLAVIGGAIVILSVVAVVWANAVGDGDTSDQADSAPATTTTATTTTTLLSDYEPRRPPAQGIPGPTTSPRLAHNAADDGRGSQKRWVVSETPRREYRLVDARGPRWQRKCRSTRP